MKRKFICKTALFHFFHISSFETFVVPVVKKNAWLFHDQNADPGWGTGRCEGGPWLTGLLLEQRMLWYRREGPCRKKIYKNTVFFECFKSFTCSKHCIRCAFQKGERKATFSDFITLHPLYQNQKSHRCHTVCDNKRRAVLLTLLGWLFAWFGWLLVARRSCSISERRARRTGGDHGVAVSQTGDGQFGTRSCVHARFVCVQH